MGLKKSYDCEAFAPQSYQTVQTPTI